MRFMLLNKIRNNLDFRIKFFLSLSVLFNIGYACFLFIIGCVYSSTWFWVMSIYYALLSCIRVYIFRKIINHEKMLSNESTAKTMQTCGYFLLIINVVVSLLMFLLIYRTTPVKHHEITVITLATYSFCVLTIAVISSIKFIKKSHYVYSSLKLIMLVSASVSIVTLTNTMLTNFGENNEPLRKIILPILSGVVSAFIITTAIIMIIKANTKLRKYKNEKKRE